VTVNDPLWERRSCASRGWLVPVQHASVDGP